MLAQNSGTAKVQFSFVPMIDAGSNFGMIQCVVWGVVESLELFLYLKIIIKKDLLLISFLSYETEGITHEMNTLWFILQDLLKHHDII